MKKLFLFLLLFPILLSARPLSSGAKISLLTCAPGDQIYSVFGHSAIRVQDPAQGLDVVYGYGTFDFSDPMFLPKFIKRDLMYFVDDDTYREFEYVYQYLKRSFHEQVFDLDSTQKQKIYDFLENNLKPENRFYLYDFFFDNCATRIRDLLYNELEGQLIIPQKDQPSELSFRDILDQYLQESPWMDFGIDLAIGAVVDEKATPWQQTFHPDYLSSVMGTATLEGGKPLVSQTQNLYEAPARNSSGSFLFSPMFLASLTLLVVAFLSWKNRDRLPKRFVGDGIFFLFVGLSGLLLLYLWFGTDHEATKQNWNILWLLPTHLVAGIMLLVNKKPSWLPLYFLISGGICLLLLLGWAVIPQAFHLAFIPLMLLLALRSGVLYQKMSQK